MIGGGLLLGTIGVFITEAGQDPLTTVWFRCIFGALSLLVWAACTGRIAELRLSGRSLIAALVTGVLMTANWALFFAAIERTSIGVATVVFHVQPLWVLALGAWWMKEHVSFGQVIAAVLALLGLTLATGLLEGSENGLVNRGSYLTGLVFCLGASLCYAGVTLIAKFANEGSSLALAWWQCMVGIICLTWQPIMSGLPAIGVSWVWLVGLGIIHTGLAYVMLYAGIERLGTTRIALLQFVYPAAAVLMDWAVYRHALSALQLAGLVLMFVALTAVRNRPLPLSSPA